LLRQERQSLLVSLTITGITGITITIVIIATAVNWNDRSN